ncbi:MAG TPA: hypothetical protein PLA12_00750 [Candidatus Hydrogenedens sp.]|nr:hypothetical protein [Candidatus Hydrogenedens sp.]
MGICDIDRALTGYRFSRQDRRAIGQSPLQDILLSGALPVQTGLERVKHSLVVNIPCVLCVPYVPCVPCVPSVP